MGELSYQNLIVLILCSLVVLLNAICAALAIDRSKRFEKSEVVLRLYTSPAPTLFYSLLCLLLPGALWHFGSPLIHFILITAAIASTVALLIITQCSTSGITAEAVFIGGKIYEWHDIYDYYIDKTRRTVIFSSNVKGGLTLKGVTRPLKYRAQDEENLESYLESQKGKYLNKIIIR
jgi:hypothetical protein